MTKMSANAVEMLEYNSDTETYRIAYDASTLSPSLAVVAALESLSDEFDHEVPLYDVIDPDALDALLAPSAPDHRSVRFSYLGFRITVSSQGFLEVRSNDTEGQEGASR